MKHRAIEVNKENYISLCETCEYMPQGTIPRTNSQVKNKESKSAHMLCVKKGYVPFVEYDNEGKPFYDVAECDSYIHYKKEERNKESKIPKRK